MSVQLAFAIIGPMMGIILATIGAIARWIRRMDATMDRVEKVIGKNGGGTLFDLVAKNHEEAKDEWTLLHAADAEQLQQIKDAQKELAMDPLTRSKIAAKLLANASPERQAALRLIIDGDDR